MTAPDDLLARWSTEPTFAIAEALEQRAREGVQRIEGRTLDEWLSVLKSGSPDEQMPAALAAFGPAAIPGLIRTLHKPTTAALLGAMAPGVPFVGTALLEKAWPSKEATAALLACLDAGGISRDQLVLPPGARHKYGTHEKQLAILLVQLGVAVAREMVLYVERTVGLCHQNLVWTLEQRYAPHGRDLPDELMPVLAAILTGDETFGRSEAAWLAVACRERAAPLKSALLHAVQTGGGKTKRGALTSLARLRVPATEALTIIEPLLEPALSGPHRWTLPLDEQFLLTATIDALAALEPPPVHLADRFEAVLDGALDNDTVLANHLTAALARLRPERVVAMLTELRDVTTKRSHTTAVACLETDAIPRPLRLAWIARLLGETNDADAIRLTSQLPDRPAELVAPLCSRIARGRPIGATVAVLEQHPELTMRELEPHIASSDATVRRHVLDALFALQNGDAIARYLVDRDPLLMRRAARWLVLHGGAQLLAHLSPEAR